jgi:hypothetical protein
MLNRRQFIEFGTKGVAAYALADVFGDCELYAQEAVVPRNTAKTCIFIQMIGGPTHLETWDAKPGPWTPPDLDIRSYAGGVTMSNKLFPMLSQHANNLVLLRSVEAWEAAHDRAQYYVQTAYAKNPAFQRERPSLGAVVAYELGSKKGDSEVLPPFIGINANPIGAGFLSAEFAPFNVGSGGNGIGTLSHPQGRDRFQRRYLMLQELDRSLRASPYDKEMRDLGDFNVSARSLMYNDVVDSMFRFSTAERDRYGASGFGNACIVARNIVKADLGARFVTIMHGGWDQHNGLFNLNNAGNIYNLGKQFDTGLGTLIDDLKASAAPAGRSGTLFDNTLIIAMGDFGRTPGNLNSGGGRDHYRNVQAALLTGGGTRGPKTIGQTDANGARIIDFGWSQQRTIRMEDITATMYSALGINWTRTIADTPSGRRYEYVQYASRGLYGPVNEVF